jgi:hypothetical protein
MANAARERFWLPQWTKRVQPIQGNRENPVWGGRGCMEEAMKEALATAVLVLFAAILLLIPALWEPVTEDEARELLGRDCG